MLALQAYEKRLCPLCGMDTNICHDQQTIEHLYRQAEVELCFTTYKRNQALAAYRDSGAPDPNAAGAITTSLTPRTTT